MSVNGKEPPPYNIPGQVDDGVKVYHVHTPFNPPSSTIPSDNYSMSQSQSQGKPVYTSGGGGIGGGGIGGGGIGGGGIGGGGIGGGGGAPTQKFVSYETELGRSEGMTTCTSCQQQVMTNVTYKVGAYAWLMCILFILCGLVVGCCLIPFFMKHFKDAYHSCPRCNRILHVDKKRCC
ncbi:cell death-inducing p53-target protein 1 [Salmo salar]|uniref:Cell death-inducing p53-target protein 1 n=1 Tax=Salmo salar TaxID=8030 RepID=A0ABM3ELF7_SALSA|nr:cell death-inducing p53-target protein 1 [Salmo salar]